MKESLLLLKYVLETWKLKSVNISKTVYIDTLDDIVDTCNNTYHRIIKMKSINVNTYIDFNVKNVINYLRRLKFKLTWIWIKIMLFKKRKTLYRGYM